MATDEADEATELLTLEPDSEAAELADEAEPLAAPVALPDCDEKIVVLPIVEVMVELSETMVLMRAEVVIAEELPALAWERVSRGSRYANKIALTHKTRGRGRFT